MRVGVLALQGDFREHIAALVAVGVEAIPVKTAAEINAIDALVLPGGESTTIAKLASIFRSIRSDCFENKIRATCLWFMRRANSVG